MAGRAVVLKPDAMWTSGASKTIMSPLPTSMRILEDAGRLVETFGDDGTRALERDDPQLASTPKPHIHRLPTHSHGRV